MTGAALEEDEPLDEPEDELGLEAVVGVRVICPGQTTGGGTYRVVVTVTGFIGVAGIERGMTGYGAELRGDVPVETGVAGDTVGATTGVARGGNGSTTVLFDGWSSITFGPRGRLGDCPHWITKDVVRYTRIR